VKPLNPPHAGVLNIPSFKLLEPLESDLGALGEVGSREFALMQQADGLLKERFGHAGILGKTLPTCQQFPPCHPETLYRPPSLTSVSMKLIPTDHIQRTLSRNVKTLRDARITNDGAISSKASGGVSKKSVNNMANARHFSRVDGVADVAHALDVEPWQLFVEELPDDAVSLRQMTLLIKAYVKLEERGRENILRTAEVEAKDAGIWSEIAPSPHRSKKADIQRIEKRAAGRGAL
jgi:hypothetical protein